MAIEIGDFPTAAQGWVCPICGRVYSPSTPMCFYCQNNGQTNVITSDHTESTITPIHDMMVHGIDWPGLFKFMNEHPKKGDDDGLR